MIAIISDPKSTIKIHAEHHRHGFRQALTRSATEDSLQPISKHFDEFMAKTAATKIQNDAAYDIAEALIKSAPVIPIHFERAIEECEIVFVSESENAHNILVLDEDGDLMLSHFPMKGEGWRTFINHNEIDFELVVYKLLSL